LSAIGAARSLRLPSQDIFAPVGVEYFDKLAYLARERFRKPNEHRQTRDLHASFEIADERLIRFAAIRKLLLTELKRDMDDGVIVATSTGLGLRISREELMAAAMRLWEQATIEDALGEDAAAVLPEAIRLVLLRVRVPRYQRDMLVALAQKHGTTIDEIVTRELEDVACAHALELAAVVPTLDAGLSWPDGDAFCAN